MACSDERQMGNARIIRGWIVTAGMTVERAIRSRLEFSCAAFFSAQSHCLKLMSPGLGVRNVPSASLTSWTAAVGQCRPACVFVTTIEGDERIKQTAVARTILAILEAIRLSLGNI
jgi:hypothetical protein